MSESNFKKFGKNTRGRDFCVGDIHGAFDSVIRRMKQAGFNEDVDRLFCTGDLVDRGPQSSRVRSFLKKSYVHSARGNHDNMISSTSIPELRQLAEIDFNGMNWICKQSDQTILEIQQLLSELPFAIEIETERGSVGIVHAEVPLGMTWPDFVLRLQEGDSDVMETALFGRDRIETDYADGVPGIGRVFVGHSIQWNGPVSLGNVFFIDSGAIFQELEGDAGFLTLANMACSTSVLLQQKPSNDPVGLYPHASTGPFGNSVNGAL